MIGHLRPRLPAFFLGAVALGGGTHARAEFGLLADGQKTQVQQLLIEISQKFPSDKYFILGVGASPAALVDALNLIKPGSAASVPVTGARDLIENSVIGQLFHSYRTSPIEKAAIAKKAVGPGREPLRDKITLALQDQVKGRKVLVVDLVVHAAALMMVKENCAEFFPHLTVEGLALDVRGTFEPPNASYHVIEAGARTAYPDFEEIAGRLERLSRVPRWRPSEDPRETERSELRRSPVFVERWNELIRNLIFTDMYLATLHSAKKEIGQGSACDLYFGEARPKPGP